MLSHILVLYPRLVLLQHPILFLSLLLPCLVCTSYFNIPLPPSPLVSPFHVLLPCSLPTFSYYVPLLCFLPRLPSQSFLLVCPPSLSSHPFLPWFAMLCSLTLLPCHRLMLTSRPYRAFFQFFLSNFSSYGFSLCSLLPMLSSQYCHKINPRSRLGDLQI